MEDLMRQRAHVFWFTGLSGAGKTTLVTGLRATLHQGGFKTVTVDGDDMRGGICRDLGFSLSDRYENVRRAAEVCKIFVDSGFVVLASFISPLQAHRDAARAIVGTDCFAEVFVDCPLAVCETRDPRGLYKKARLGEVKEFTGIDSPYEIPPCPDIVVRTHGLAASACIAQLKEFVVPRIMKT
jgi:adenylylsulfate kinase